MAHLKYYEEEQKGMPENWKEKLNDTEVQYYFKRLRIHYKFRQVLKLYGNNGAGRCSSWQIRLSHNPTLHVLGHEVGHAIQWRKQGYYSIKGKKWHTKQLTSIIKRVMKHIETNQDKWNRQIHKNIDKKKCVQENKKKRDEKLKAWKKSAGHKLQQVEFKILKWETKKKRADNALKKLYRKRKYYESKWEVKS